MRSPKSVFIASTPCRSSARSFSWNHATASSFVKSTIPMPGLPQVPLPDAAVRSLAGGSRPRRPRRTAAERCAMYGFVQIDTFRPRSCRRREHPLGVGEHAGVPGEVRPVELAHPEAVEVEDRQRQVAVAHAVEERVHRRLVVVGGEARAEPGAVAPRGHLRRAPGERGVALEDRRRRRAGDDEVLERLALRPRTAPAARPPSRPRRTRGPARSRTRRSRGRSGRTGTFLYACSLEVPPSAFQTSTVWPFLISGPKRSPSP